MLYEIPTFYVGQEVVANCDYSHGSIIFFKKGDEFVIKDCFKGCCGDWRVDIGISNLWGGMTCSICNKIYLTTKMEFLASRFSPKIQIDEFISMKQLVEEKLELISQN